MRSLPLSPREAFLLSHVDGATSEADLSELIGVDGPNIRAALERLVTLGVITFDGGAASRDGARHAGPPPEPTRASQTHFKSVNYGREAEEQVDLDSEKKTKILEIHSRLERVDYYALLGVPETADKKEIKRAYYATAPEYHPDKFYGKNLGSFKAKMEAIFAHLTFAYETLSSLERRSEYDTYRATQKQTRSIEEMLKAAAATFTAPSAEESARAKSSQPAPRISSQPAAATTVSSTPPASGPVRSPSFAGRLPDDDRARRAALARKLGIGRGSNPPDPRTTSPGMPIPNVGSASSPSSAGGHGSAPPASAKAAAIELGRRHSAVQMDARRSQIRRYVEAGEAAMGENPAAAANAYRLALTLEPEDPAIIAGHEKAAKAAAVALADGYLKQGDYESGNKQWVEAARSYTKAAAGKPSDPIVLQKAAQALLKSAGDLHQAADLAKRSVALSPKKLDPRLVLIEVCLAAKLPLAARREIEAAREIFGHDDRLSALSKLLK